ncbi:MAG: 1-phosphofructokinase [Frankiaceae bacterium]|nr:1-phosphofructokinase [Frankiaceae bacterium]
MIITFTPNPSVDRTVEVDGLVRGAVLRATATRVDPGGKGVNVSRALAAAGCKTRAVLPSGGSEGLQLGALLEIEGIDVVPVPIDGAIRANVTVVEPDGTTTTLNALGPAISADEAAALVGAVEAAVTGPVDWVACCGSLPRGLADDFYADLVRTLAGSGARVCVDSSGAPLLAALDARPDLVKPNAEELAEAAGHPIRTLGDAVAAAEALRARGVGAVLASLGADGALLVDADGAHHGEATVLNPRSTVGAGDALLAGFLAGGGAGPHALREALAWGAAAVSLPGSRMPTPADLDHSSVRLHPSVDSNRNLEGQSS